MFDLLCINIIFKAGRTSFYVRSSFLEQNKNNGYIEL